MSKSKTGTLYKRMRKDLDIFRQNKDLSSLSAVRFVIGEIQRDPNKDYSNKKVKNTINVIRKNMTKSPEPDHLVISLINTYIGTPVASGEVIEWLEGNGYNAETIQAQKNPSIIIGIIKKSRAFGERDIDGKMVNGILADIISGTIKEQPVMVEDVQGDGLMKSLLEEMYPDEDVFNDKKKEVL